MAASTFLDRTLRRLRRLAVGRPRDLAEVLSPGLDGDGDLARLEDALRDCLRVRGDPVSALARAAELCEAYAGLDGDGRARFLSLLAESFAADGAAVDNAARVLLQADDAGRRPAEEALKTALEAPRLALFRQLGGLPHGVKFLVDLRAELPDLALEDAVRAALDGELRGLLAAWFDVGFLELRQITWEAPADLLERLIAYEAVHEIRSWSDLKNRLDSDRRCFAYFHPRMPGEPLIFVEVALTNGLAGDMRALLDESAPPLDPEAADTAIFYSISNAQRGLAGISFGNFLIKRVVDQLRGEFPNLRTFATLSPMPGFCRWLKGAENAADVRDRLHGEPPAELEKPLLALAARYLLTAKRDRHAADPVAHFHLTNGARVERLAFLADRSPVGLARSAGVMVNYVYKLDEIDANHEAYTSDGTIAAAAALRAML